jgi:hypothetical protein
LYICYIVRLVRTNAGEHAEGRSSHVNPEPDTTLRYDGPPGDHDQDYTFGRPPVTYLAPRQVVRLTILRSKLSERPFDGIDSDAAAA